MNKFLKVYLCIVISIAVNSGCYAHISPGGVIHDEGIVTRVLDLESALNDFMNVALFCAAIGVFLGGVSQYSKYRDNPGSIRLGTVIATFATSLALLGLMYIPMPI